jgi:hypothetical protein
MEQPPHPMRLGDDEGDYYRGSFAGPKAGSEPAPTRGPSDHANAPAPGSTTEGAR